MMCPRWYRRSRQAVLLSAGVALVLSGCSSPTGKGSGLSKLTEATRPVRTASYQQHPVDDGPPKKVRDPLELNLRYARWMEETENFEKAQQHYRIVLSKQPQHMEALLGMARIDAAAGRHAEAEAGFRKALGIQPDSPVAQHALGQFHSSNGRLRDALPLLRKAMTGDPANKSYRFHYAVALARMGNPDAALPHFRDAVGQAAAHYNVGLILKSQREYQRAELHLMEALSHNPGFEPAKQAVTEVRQLRDSAPAYAEHPSATPVQIQPAGHSQREPLTPSQKEQLRNQRSMPVR